MSLFEENHPPKPLAEQMRPHTLEDVIGQKEALALLNAFVEQGEMPSLLFWGPPGSGKTSMSRLMASLLGWESATLNATSASVKELRERASEAKEVWRQSEVRTLLFIDEIHRLNKGQQDVLLPMAESGTITLAGSTTENPYFSLNQALRSRVQIIRLEPLAPADIRTALSRALAMKAQKCDTEALDWIASRAAGDLRLAYTVLESAFLLAKTQERGVRLDDVVLCLRQTVVTGDRRGDQHFDLASAFQKALRGSDENASIYYLCRFLKTGEDPLFIARRLLVTASEDVGNADPKAFLMATSAFQAVEKLGMPEARIPLAQATLYVARAPKSNEAITAFRAANQFIKTRPLDPIPAPMRDAYNQGAAELGHAKDEVDTHRTPGQPQRFLPKSVQGQVFTSPYPPKEELNEEDIQWFYKFLKQKNGDGEWFTLDSDALAIESSWPLGKVRLALNRLVQKQRLQFKRLFKLEP